MKKGWKIVLAILCAFVIAAGSFIAAVQYLNTRYAAALSAREEDSPVQAKAAEVQEIIETYFIDDYDEDTLADGAASGMVDATGDEWSYYLSADEVAAYEESMANAYVGVGITITEDAEAGGMRVEEVAAGGPAEEAGIRVGDLLLAVEGEDVLTLGIDGTRNLVRGEEGTRVNMHFSRNGTEYDVSVERRSIETPVVTGELLDENIGYIKIGNFDERSAAETIAFVKDLIGQGAEALLFDVRFNPGGYADELVKVLDYLLPEGDLFRSVDYAGRQEPVGNGRDAGRRGRPRRRAIRTFILQRTRTGRRSAISGRNRHIDTENLLTDRARCGYNGNWRFRNILPRFSGDDDRKDRELWQKNSKSARSASRSWSRNCTI